jgi:DNA (cytosine-5)-methyltransferase 1
MNSIELFAGAGGLALGTSHAGFQHLAVIEWDAHACRTLQANSLRHAGGIGQWSVDRRDLRDYHYTPYKGMVDFVFGGPPCQPFSLGGNHKGHEDNRNMFPSAIRAVREVEPKAFMFENVKGLLRKGFANYFSYIKLQLSYPSVIRRSEEDWSDHLGRLERLYTGGVAPEYNVVYRLLNAADYGVPQQRERVFLVGIRSDIRASFSFPEPTHDEDRLLYDKWVAGTYWERHGITGRRVPHAPVALAPRIAKLRCLLPCMMGEPWRTVRDAICDLPRVGVGKTSRKIANHYLNPGAKSYPGHTGSDYDEPSKALKAGDHGVPGGENTLRRSDGSVRYLSVREGARIQTFPDDWVFEGSWTECMRQLGNAVPVRLAETVATRLASVIATAGHHSRTESLQLHA